MIIVPDKINMSDTDDDCVLESVTYVDHMCLNKQNFAYVYQENPLLAEFIVKCYDIENSQGMTDVINKALLKYYNESSQVFKKSADFKTVLKNSINLLETVPKHKFSHIKHLCDIMRYSIKKRIKPTTLLTNLKENSNKNTVKRKSPADNISTLSKKCVIDPDTVVLTETSNHNSNLEEICSISSRTEYITIDSVSSSDDNKLLVPRKSMQVNVIQESSNAEKIYKIEKEIARCKSIIAKLDELEVDDDSKNSPYIRSERLKAKIVSLYAELCTLTGDSAVKKRLIHLKVAEGHPEGPVRCLETFLNNNVCFNGTPAFPDFSDVVDCVTQANDKLGWPRKQILKEARALFTLCGVALQKRRQNREWLDLLHKVKLERCDDDPADNDPALLKRLEDNRRRGTKRETEVLEKFAMMQTVGKSQTTVIQTHDSIREDESGGEMNVSADTSQDVSQDKSQGQEDSAMNSDENNDTIQSENNDEVIIKKEPEEEIEERLEELGENYNMTITEIEEDPFLIIEISDTSDEENS